MRNLIRVFIRKKKIHSKKLALKLTCILQPKCGKFSPTTEIVWLTYIQRAGNVGSNTREISLLLCYDGQFKPAWNLKHQILVYCFPTIAATRTRLLSTLLVYTPGDAYIRELKRRRRQRQRQRQKTTIVLHVWHAL